MPRCQRCSFAQAASRPPPRQAQPSPASLASDGQRRWHCWISPEPVPATHSITTRPPSASAVQSGPGSLIRTRRGIRSSFFAFLLLSRSLSSAQLFLSVLSVPHTILFLSFSFLPSSLSTSPSSSSPSFDDRFSSLLWSRPSAFVVLALDAAAKVTSYVVIGVIAAPPITDRPSSCCPSSSPSSHRGRPPSFGSTSPPSWSLASASGSPWSQDLDPSAFPDHRPVIAACSR